MGEGSGSETLGLDSELSGVGVSVLETSGLDSELSGVGVSVLETSGLDRPLSGVGVSRSETPRRDRRLSTGSLAKRGGLRYTSRPMNRPASSSRSVAVLFAAFALAVGCD